MGGGERATPKIGVSALIGGVNGCWRMRTRGGNYRENFGWDRGCWGGVKAMLTVFPVT